MTKRTVFFGPFIGELGWELHSWSGWVNRACHERFAGWRRVVATHPGRRALYPAADAIWTHPDWWCALPTSPRGYVTDGWIRGVPARTGYVSPIGDVAPYAEQLLAEYRQRLPGETVVFCPFHLNRAGAHEPPFGMEVREPVRSEDDVITHMIPLHVQAFERLRASPEGGAALPAEVCNTAPGLLVSLFPRWRPVRPELNWSETNYRQLIRYLQAAGYTVAILGEPGGCYFADEVPAGCLDLIHVETERRLDIHLACLERSAFAVGAISGAIHLAVAAGCPTLTWGDPRRHFLAHERNVLRTRHYYVPDAQCNVEVLWREIRLFARGRSLRQRLSQQAYYALNRGRLGQRIYWHAYWAGQRVAGRSFVSEPVSAA